MDFAKLLAKLDSIDSKQTLNEGWEDMMKAVKDREKEKGTGKFDKKKISTGTVYTRKAEKDSDAEDDEDKKTAKAKKKVKEAEEKVDEDDVDEGNKFSGERDAAIKAGKTEFEVDGKKYQVKESEEKCPDCGKVHDGECKDDDKDEDDDKEKVDENLVAPGQVKWAVANVGKYVNHYTAKGKTVQEAKNILYRTSHERAKKLAESQKMAECYDQAMGQAEQESGVNISSNLDTNSGSKSLTISARGHAAEELAQILKLSGLMTPKDMHAEHEPEVAVVAQEEYANEPQPQTQGIGAQLEQGTDMHSKGREALKVNGGGNPMMEDRELALLESRLMKELESIKIKK